MRVLGIDLAWAEGSAKKPANETGLVAVDGSGTILDAGWRCGLDEACSWIEQFSSGDTLAMVDAPLVIDNAAGQRLCETQLGQRYGRWKVSANSSNASSPRQAGVHLRERLEAQGWRYDDGASGPPSSGRVLSEVYPYTTIVGTPELLGDATERPRYKRKPKGMPIGQFRPERAAACNGLLHAMGDLSKAQPPISLRSHPVTRTLLEEDSPLGDRGYKHREDLLDAVLCAWTGLLWLAFGFDRCQVLGRATSAVPAATIIAPALPEQRGPGITVPEPGDLTGSR